MKDRLLDYGPVPAIRTSEPALQLFQAVHIDSTMQFLAGQLARLAARSAVGAILVTKASGTGRIGRTGEAFAS
jgi:hypothetical protein